MKRKKSTLSSSKKEITYPKKNSRTSKSDHFQFVRETNEPIASSWAERQAQKFYGSLFKEYCLIDLSQMAMTGSFGLRWRLRREVEMGKGTLFCAELSCDREDLEEAPLRSWEVPFEYVEGGQKKCCLVKVRLCQAHGQCLSSVPADGVGKDDNESLPQSASVVTSEKRKGASVSVSEEGEVQQMEAAQGTPRGKGRKA